MKKKMKKKKENEEENEDENEDEDDAEEDKERRQQAEGRHKRERGKKESTRASEGRGRTMALFWALSAAPGLYV